MQTISMLITCKYHKLVFAIEIIFGNIQKSNSETAD